MIVTSQHFGHISLLRSQLWILPTVKKESITQICEYQEVGSLGLMLGSVYDTKPLTEKSATGHVAAALHRYQGISSSSPTPLQSASLSQLFGWP